MSSGSPEVTKAVSHQRQQLTKNEGQIRSNTVVEADFRDQWEGARLRSWEDVATIEDIKALLS